MRERTRMTKEPYEFEPHNLNGQFRIGGKAFCPKCGLVALNNDFTRWAIDKGCNANDHPQYEQQRKKAKRF